MLPPLISRNDRKAYWLTGILSVVVFAAVVVLGKVKMNVNPQFDIHIFALANAFINTGVAILLATALMAVKRRNYLLHRNLVIAAMILSVLFLVSYIAHHLLAGEAKFGDADHNGIVDEAEKIAVGGLRYVYLLILATHIILASIILPFILLTAYRGLTGEYEKHRKLAKYTWPLWLYVAVTGPIIYMMISPYYTN